MRAFSLGQPSRGATRRSSSRPKLAMARATMPMLSASCGRTRIRTGVLPAPGGGAPLWPARRMPCRSLRSTRRAQNQYSSPAQVLARCSRLCGCSVSVPAPAGARPSAVKVISRMAGDEIVEGLDPELLRAQPAAGTGGIVRLAAPLRAVGEDRLQGRAVETGHGQLGQARVDRLLVARVHDRRDRQRRAGSDGSSARLALRRDRATLNTSWCIIGRSTSSGDCNRGWQQCRMTSAEDRSPRRSSGARPSGRRRRSRAPCRSSQ